MVIDEATSALTSADVEKVYAMLAELQNPRASPSSTSRTACTRSRRSPTELPCSANGRHIETFDKGVRSTADIVQLMIGRDIATQYPGQSRRVGR